MSRVFVTGVGIISAIGDNLSQNHESLQLGKSGVKKSKYFQSKFAENYPFGEVPHSTEDLREKCGLENSSGFTRTDFLAHLACWEAIENSNISEEELTNPSTGMISATTVGGMCLTDEAYLDANGKRDESEFCESYSNGRHLINLVRTIGIKGQTGCINTACSSSANSIMYGARLIKAGRAKRMIVGGVDSLAKFTANGFNSLQILSSQNCKPFDKLRQGLNLGEGSAYLVLESDEVIGNKRPLAELKGWGNATDAHHASALSDQAYGPTLSIQAALTQSKLFGVDIDYVNAHGTATLNNDQAEIVAIKKALGRFPAMNSTKTYTGHTLGAAGAIEAVISLLALKHGELYPSLNCKEPEEEVENSLVKSLERSPQMKHVLSNSFGFAGNCSSLIFSR